MYILRMIVMGFASSIHEKNYYEKLYSEVMSVMSSFKYVDVINEIYTGVPSISLDKYDLIIAVHLTGGTSGLVYKTVTPYNKPVLLIANDKHNSLASALSVRARLLDKGYRVKLIYYNDKNELLEKFTYFYRAIMAADLLRNMRVLEVSNGDKPSNDVIFFEKFIGFNVIHVNYDELMNVSKSMSETDYLELVKHISDYIDLSGIDSSYLKELISLYYGLRKLVVENRANAVSIDCFPLVIRYHVTPCLAVAMLNNDGIPTACENDYYSLLILSLSLSLTGYPGWIANPSGARRDYLRFAHCTIAPLIGHNCYLMPHFETGYPYAVVCNMRHKRGVFARLNKKLEKLVVIKAKIIESGHLEPGYCRTQSIVDMGPYSADLFVEEAVGNHHVFIPWVKGLDKMLKYVAWWMNWLVEEKN